MTFFNCWNNMGNLKSFGPTSTCGTNLQNVSLKLPKVNNFYLPKTTSKTRRDCPAINLKFVDNN